MVNPIAPRRESNPSLPETLSQGVSAPEPPKGNMYCASFYHPSGAATRSTTPYQHFPKQPVCTPHVPAHYITRMTTSHTSFHGTRTRYVCGLLLALPSKSSAADAGTLSGCGLLLSEAVASGACGVFCRGRCPQGITGPVESGVCGVFPD